MRACVRACMRARACVRVCVHACTRGYEGMKVHVYVCMCVLPLPSAEVSEGLAIFLPSAGTLSKQRRISIKYCPNNVE